MKPKKKYPYSPDYAVPPGETIREVMEALGMAQSELSSKTKEGGHSCPPWHSFPAKPGPPIRGLENPRSVEEERRRDYYEAIVKTRHTCKQFAIHLGISVQTLNRILAGEQPITSETANKLELLTGTPASFWNNLESNIP